MDKCRKDVRGLPHKTIIFAISHAHAKRLYESFNRQYPELQRHGMAEIIDSHMERADSTLDDFKDRTMPRIAISVDMLDTGVDVPAIQNLVFAKPVFSKVKFWQMIGRGTRLHTDKATGEIKKDFLIIDHWKNFAYFKLNPEGEIDHPSEPLPVRLFRLRLEKWQLLHAQQQDTQHAVEQLRAMLQALPRQSINVRPHWDELDALSERWPEPSQGAVEHLSQTVAPLMRMALLAGLDELQFSVWCERLTVSTAQYVRRQPDPYLQHLQRSAQQRRQEVFLKDWAERLDAFLKFNERDVLEGAGKMSKKQADAFAEAQYEEFAAQRRALLEAEGEAFGIRALEDAAKALPKPKGK